MAAEGRVGREICTKEVMMVKNKESGGVVGVKITPS